MSDTVPDSEVGHDSPFLNLVASAVIGDLPLEIVNTEIAEEPDPGTTTTIPS